MPIELNKHSFERRDRQRIRDQTTYVCSICGKGVQVSARSLGSPAEKIARALKGGDCPGRRIVIDGQETPVPPEIAALKDPLEQVVGLEVAVDDARLTGLLSNLQEASRAMLRAVEDKSGIANVEVYSERLAGAACDWARAERVRTATAVPPEAFDVITQLLRSARPNPKEHPTMTAAWKQAEAFLARHRPTKDALMAHVTDMVFRAEGALKDAITFYSRLVTAEQAIVDSPESDSTDRDIAARGVANAKKILDGLQALFNWEPAP